MHGDAVARRRKRKAGKNASGVEEAAVARGGRFAVDLSVRRGNLFLVNPMGFTGNKFPTKLLDCRDTDKTLSLGLG